MFWVRGRELAWHNIAGRELSASRGALAVGCAAIAAVWRCIRRGRSLKVALHTRWHSLAGSRRHPTIFTTDACSCRPVAGHRPAVFMLTRWAPRLTLTLGASRRPPAASPWPRSPARTLLGAVSFVFEVWPWIRMFDGILSPLVEVAASQRRTAGGPKVFRVREEPDLAMWDPTVIAPSSS